MKEYHGLAKQYIKTGAFFKNYIRKPLLWISIAFFCIVACSSLIFYCYGDTAFSIMLDFMGDMQQSGVVDAMGDISPVILFANNVRASTLGWVSGLIPFCFLSVWPLVVNGSMLGILLGFLGEGMELSFWGAMRVMLVGTLPHGIFEIPALLLSFAMGIALCGQLNRKLRKKPIVMPIDEMIGETARFYLLWIVPMLAIGAVIETYITPLLLQGVL